MEVCFAGSSVAGLLAFDLDLDGFYSMIKTDSLLSQVADSFYGLRPPRTESIFEALVVAIVGQQISANVARVIREGLVQDFGIPLSVDMPVSVILEVTHSEPGVKGNTATNATKPATLETGAKINVPLFINEGDKIKVDTEKLSYIERIK